MPGRLPGPSVAITLFTAIRAKVPALAAGPTRHHPHRQSAAVAAAVAVLADRTRANGPLASARLGVGLWGAFLVVLLTGSVVHEKVPWQQATIHAGDWLVKLLLISALVGRRQASRPARRASASTGRRQ